MKWKLIIKNKKSKIREKGKCYKKYYKKFKNKWERKKQTYVESMKINKLIKTYEKSTYRFKIKEWV